MSIPILSSRQLDLGLSQFFEPRPESTPGNQITLEAGWAQIENTTLFKTLQTSAAFSPVSGAGKARWDLVYLNSSVVVQTTPGVEQTEPIAEFTGAPAPAALTFPVAYVKINEAAGVVVNSDDITDLRTNQAMHVVNHNTLLTTQGGSVGQQYHTTQAQNAAIIGANAPGAGNVFRTMSDLPATHGNTQHSSTFKVEGSAPAIHGNTEHSTAFAATTDSRFPAPTQKDALVGPGSYPPTTANYYETKNSVAALLGAASKFYDIYSIQSSSPVPIAGLDTALTLVVPTPSPETLTHYIFAGTHTNYTGAGSATIDIYDGSTVIGEKLYMSTAGGSDIAFGIKTGVAGAVTYLFRGFASSTYSMNYGSATNGTWMVVLAVRP